MIDEKINQKVLLIDASSSFYRINRYSINDFIGPVDLGLYLAGRYNSLNIGTGLLAGSIFPGSNRLIFTGFSPCWGGFYISSMGGAGLVFDNLGINMLSIVGRAPSPSIMYLNRDHGEEIEVEIKPADVEKIWGQGRSGIYAIMDHVYNCYIDRYKNDPRILSVGPASKATDFGAICSVPISKSKLSFVDTWAGRGGFGSKLYREHNIAAIIYGGTFIDEDFRDRKVADDWFENKYNKKMAAKAFEATTKYRFEEKFETGGTFGVNYTTLAGQMLSFNYKSIYMKEEDRLEIHKKFILDHYLKQFNEETIKTKQQKNCGEPCMAVCKKMNGKYKKDYEPYQTMGPLSGIFDQRAAEKINHHADMYGFDAISVGGVVSWIMECLADSLIKPEDVGARDTPVFSHNGFNIEEDSMHNASIGISIIDTIIRGEGILNLEEGARLSARKIADDRGKEILDKFVYTAFARKGWMVPNQYWTPGVLSPMAIMGKYYMNYGKEFYPPRELGRINAERFKKELILDNLGICRFHRNWAEEMMPDIIDSLYGLKNKYLEKTAQTAAWINSRNSSILWESERCADFIYTFLKRNHEIEGNKDESLLNSLKSFEKDKKEAALNWWYETHKGAAESLREV